MLGYYRQVSPAFCRGPARSGEQRFVWPSSVPTVTKVDHPERLTRCLFSLCVHIAIGFGRYQIPMPSNIIREPADAAVG